MAKKQEKDTRQEKDKKKKRGSKVSAIVSVILSCFLLIVSLTGQGSLGAVSYELFTYFFGNFYPILLVVSVVTGLAKIFSHKFHFTFYIGITIFEIAAFVLSGYLYDQGIVDFESYKNFAVEIVDIFVPHPDVVLDFGAGLVGYGLFMLCLMAIDRTLTLLFTILALIAGLLLLVPVSWYRDVWDRFIESKEEKRQERLKEKEEYEALEKKKEEEKEERRLKEKKEDEERNRQAQEKLLEQISSLHKEESIPEDTKEPVEEEEEIPFDSSLNEHKKVISKSGPYDYPDYRKCLDAKSNIRHSDINRKAAEAKGRRLIEILHTFDIDAVLLNTYIGPSVTKFEIKPDINVKVSRIQAIQDNIKMELAAKDIRIEAPIPGRNAVGIEIPNAETTAVRMIELIPELKKNPFNTTFALGKGLLNNNVYCDVAKMPHLLIAGATGSGKSVCENAIITSILLRSHPDAVKLVLIDPKKVEFTPYHDVPHLLWPVITDTKMAVLMLEKMVVIMEQRFELFAESNAKNIETYNRYVDEYNEDCGEGVKKMDKMPYIVVIVDELADLMSTSKNEVVGSIQRITSLARASGIHLIVATQRPSTDVVNGVIKNNIPSRIAFAMPTGIDSRTILDQYGAERLLGKGDMLYYPQGEPAPIRLQGVYVTDDEIEKITDSVKAKGSPNYDDTYFSILRNGDGEAVSGFAASQEQDELYDEVVEYIKEAQKCSTSLLQRKFGIGYNRSARIVDELEKNGLIGGSNGSKPREVLIKPDSKEEE